MDTEILKTKLQQTLGQGVQIEVEQ
jgi:hypothetical protein